MQILRTFSLIAGLAFSVAGLVGGPAAAAEMVVKHRQGETTLPDKPAKVLVFDLASLDTLNELGVEVHGVTSGIKPDHLKKFDEDRYTKIGTLFEPDYEAVNAAEPDLIIVAARSARKYPDLAKIAPTLDLTVDTKNFVADVKTNIATLADIFDKEAQGQKLAAEIDEAIGKVQSAAEGKGSGLLIITTGGKVAAMGPESPFGMLYSTYGMTPATQPVKTGNHGAVSSFENILVSNPDWLFVMDRDAVIGQGGTPAAQLLDNEIIRQTNAWKSGRVVYLDGYSWYVANGSISAIRQITGQLTDEFSKH